MERVFGMYAPYLYVILRVVSGVLFACHGAQKLFGVLGYTPNTHRGRAGIKPTRVYEVSPASCNKEELCA